MSPEARTLSFEVSPRVGSVAALLHSPARPRVLYVLAHGAGADMNHSFLSSLAGALCEQDVATFRYQFPYTQKGSRRPDPPGILEATVRAAVTAAASALPGVPLVAGGKSMGGRMTSQAQAKAPLPGVRGLAFVGFPLHPAGEPGTARAQHLKDVKVPMLFLQGTRDTLAELNLIGDVCGKLGERATLHVVQGGDHSFAVLKRDGRKPEEVRSELVSTFRQWFDTTVSGS
jgi:predicted alpha/beta-hydrolase family hydrolase